MLSTLWKEKFLWWGVSTQSVRLHAEASSMAQSVSEYTKPENPYMDAQHLPKKPGVVYAYNCSTEWERDR